MVHKKYAANQQKFAEKLFAAYPSLGATADDAFEKIASHDPTATHKSDNTKYAYLEWVCSRILRERPREQDLYKIREDLENYSLLARFDKVRSTRKGTIFYKPFVNAEIGQYSIATLAETILPYQEQINDRKKSLNDLENEREDAEKESIILYDGAEGRIVVPLTMEASQFWGKGTKWCISATKSDNLFHGYNQNGEMPILMFLPKGTREKFATNEHDKNVRDMMDEGLGGKLFESEASSKKKSVEILSDFIAKAFASDQFRTDKVQENEHIVRAFHEMALRAPTIYNRILQKTEAKQIPAFFSPVAVMGYSKRYMGMNTSDDSDYSGLLGDFYSHDLLLLEVLANPTLGNVRQRALESAGAASLERAILNIVTNILAVPEEGINGTSQEIFEQFRDKNQRALKFQESIEDHGYQLETEIENLSIDYLTKVPKELWRDTDFCLKTLEVIHFLPIVTLEKIPEAYQNHDVWKGVLESVGPGIEDLHSALLLYGASTHLDTLDYSPLVKIVEGLYADGLENDRDIEIISSQMSKCDFTNLLEKTIARRPELFADIPPEKQTLPMAIAAVKHDPGSLADMAADLFKGNKRPIELTAAFNLLPVDSIERAAVADYFTEHKLG